ncbi:hypothetical protein EMWEY_00018210, partial [Eimeria maxima]
MGYLGSSALAIGAFAAVLLAIIIAFHDLALEKLRKYCTPTAQEAEWAAAYVEIDEEDVDVLDYGEERLGACTLLYVYVCVGVWWCRGVSGWGAESFLEEPEGHLLTGLWDGRI